jgi:lycopene cyclase domain-containing protein
MSLTYLLLNVFILAAPLSLIFDKRTAYYRRMPALAFALAVVSSSYLIWDVVVTARGEWSFNQSYLTGLQVLNIPIEEMLFFVTVPFSCLFLYEVVLYAAKDTTFNLPDFAVWGAVIVLAVCGIALRPQGYTSKALLSCAFFLSAALVLDRPLLNSRRYWLWLAVCYIPFLIINSVLTALPVVEYNPAAIFGVRIFTIPIEDFFYNYAMLSFYLLFYRRRRERSER